jgi:hypothetical protein
MKDGNLVAVITADSRLCAFMNALSLYLRSDINARRSACILLVEIDCISAEGDGAIESSSSPTPHLSYSLKCLCKYCLIVSKP